MIILPTSRVIPFDLSKADPYVMLARVESAEIHVQASWNAEDGAVQTYPTLAVVPSAQEVATQAAIAAGELGPYYSADGWIGDLSQRFDGFAVYLPLDRRIVSIAVPFAASVFVFESTGQAFVSGLFWTRDLAPACGCRVMA